MKDVPRNKTPKTAVVIIPPEGMWSSIQGIRRRYDRNVRRWMPHITLLYPFRPPSMLEGVCQGITDACREFDPFDIELAHFRCFTHSRRSITLWLAPEPEGKVADVQRALQHIFPDCDDVARHAGGYTPHLSVGQMGSARDAVRLLGELEVSWSPIRFTATKVSLIWRGDPPDDVFRIHRDFPLGSPCRNRNPSQI